MKAVKIGEKVYEFKLGTKACKKVESLMGKSIFEVLGANADGGQSLPRIGDLSVLFWAALIGAMPELTVDEADDLMDAYLEEPEHDLGSLVSLIQEALNFTKGTAAPQTL